MEDEDLRELLQTLRNGRWLITLITVLAVGTSAILSFFVLSPVYEAKATLKLGFHEAGYLMNSFYPYPEFSLEDHRTQIVGPQSMDWLAREYRLEGGANEARGKVNINVIKNQIEIVVSDSDPQRAQTMANALAERYWTSFSELNEERLAQLQASLESQMEEEGRELRKVNQELLTFLQESGVEELRREINAKMNLLDGYSMDGQGALQAMVMPGYRNQLKNIDVELNTLRGRAGELEKALAEMWASDSDPVRVSLTQYVADTRVEMAALRARKGALEAAVASVEKELGSLRVSLPEKQSAQDELERKVQSLKERHRAFGKKLDEMRIIQSMGIQGTTINVVSPAIQPQSPVSPKKRLNIVLAGVLGVMAGIFLVLFLNSWRALIKREVVGCEPSAGS